MKTFRVLFSLLILVGVILSGCAPQPAAEATVSQETAPAAAEATEAPAVVPTEAPTAEPVSLVGGNLVWYMSGEPDTLDWQKSALLPSYVVDYYLSAALFALTDNKDIIPWLAESYTISADGLIYDIKLRQDVKFTDGTPLTANEYAWSL